MHGSCLGSNAVPCGLSAAVSVSPKNLRSDVSPSFALVSVPTHRTHLQAQRQSPLLFPGLSPPGKTKRQHLLSSPCGSLAVLAIGYALPLSNIHVKSGLAMLAPELEVFCLRLRISFLIRPLLAVWTSISSILDFECSRFFYLVQELSLTF